MGKLIDAVTTGDWRIDGIFFLIMGLLAFGFGVYWFLRMKDWWGDDR